MINSIQLLITEDNVILIKSVIKDDKTVFNNGGMASAAERMKGSSYQ